MIKKRFYLLEAEKEHTMITANFLGNSFYILRLKATLIIAVHVRHHYLVRMLIIIR